MDGDREAQPGVHAGAVVGRPGCRGTCRCRRSRRSRRTCGRSRPRVIPRMARVEVEVVAARELVVEARAGRDQPGDPAAGEHRAGVGAHHAADQLEQGRLAGAVEAHQADGLALLHGEADVVDGVEDVVGLAAARLGQRDLLERAVVGQRERLGDVLDRDRWWSSEALRDLRLEAGEEPLGEHQQHEATPSVISRPAREQVVGQVQGRRCTPGRWSCRSRSRAGSAAPPRPSGSQR